MADITASILDAVRIVSDTPVSRNSSILLIDTIDESDNIADIAVPSGVVIRDALGVTYGNTLMFPSGILVSDEINLVSDYDIDFKNFITPSGTTISLGDADNKNISSFENYEADSVIIIGEQFNDDCIINIVSPQNGAVLIEGQEVELKATVDDKRDGVLIADDKIRWYSSVGGIIANGNNIAFKPAAVGDIAISVRVEGYRNSDSLTIKVVANTPPLRPENCKES